MTNLAAFGRYCRTMAKQTTDPTERDQWAMLAAAGRRGTPDAGLSRLLGRSRAALRTVGRPDLSAPGHPRGYRGLRRAWC